MAFDEHISKHKVLIFFWTFSSYFFVCVSTLLVISYCCKFLLPQTSSLLSLSSSPPPPIYINKYKYTAPDSSWLVCLLLCMSIFHSLFSMSFFLLSSFFPISLTHSFVFVFVLTPPCTQLGSHFRSLCIIFLA